MRTIVAISVTLVAAFVFSSTSRAQEQICGKVPEFTLTQKETEKVKGDIDGSANFLKGFVGKADLGGKIESERKKYYQTDAAIVAQQKDAYLNYMICVILWNDKAMSTKDKLDEIRKTRESFDKKVSESGSNSQQISAVLKNIKFNVTSFANLKGKLGVPTYEEDEEARYDLGGYVVFVNYHSQTKKEDNYPLGSIYKLTFITNRDQDDASRELTIDGSWNDVTCYNDGTQIGSCGPIVKTKGLGMAPLREFLLRPDRAHPGTQKVSNDWFPFYTISFNNGSGGPSVMMYLRAEAEDMRAVGLDPDKVDDLFTDKTELADKRYKFGPPQVKSLEEQEKLQKDRIGILGKLLVTRLEIWQYGSYVSDTMKFSNELFP